MCTYVAGWVLTLRLPKSSQEASRLKRYPPLFSLCRLLPVAPSRGSHR